MRLEAREAAAQVFCGREGETQDEVRVVVFLAFGVESGRFGRVLGERKVFLEEGLHVVEGFVPAAVAEGAGFEFGEDCEINVLEMNVRRCSCKAHTL